MENRGCIFLSFFLISFCRTDQSAFISPKDSTEHLQNFTEVSLSKPYKVGMKCFCRFCFGKWEAKYKFWHACSTLVDYSMKKCPTSMNSPLHIELSYHFEHIMLQWSQFTHGSCVTECWITRHSEEIQWNTCMSELPKGYLSQSNILDLYFWVYSEFCMRKRCAIIHYERMLCLKLLVA